MQITISGKNLELTEAIKNYVQQKMDKLDHYLESTDVISCSVVVETRGGQKSKGAPSAKVETMLVLPGVKIRCEEIASDLYEAIDIVQEKLERKIRDIKEKSLSQRKERPSGEDVFSPKELAKIIRRKNLDMGSPITEDEAVAEMEMLGHDFYIYLDAITGKNAVVYRRKDGGYGLIQTQ